MKRVVGVIAGVATLVAGLVGPEGVAAGSDRSGHWGPPQRPLEWKQCPPETKSASGEARPDRGTRRHHEDIAVREIVGRRHIIEESHVCPAYVVSGSYPAFPAAAGADPDTGYIDLA